jgi:hypothetical protein
MPDLPAGANALQAFSKGLNRLFYNIQSISQNARIAMEKTLINRLLSDMIINICRKNMKLNL